MNVEKEGFMLWRYIQKIKIVSHIMFIIFRIS